MTHSGGKPHKVGDLGQRFEVWYSDSQGVEHVFGWGDTPDRLLASIMLNPTMFKGRSVDRGTPEMRAVREVVRERFERDYAGHRFFERPALLEAILSSFLAALPNQFEAAVDAKLGQPSGSVQFTLLTDLGRFIAAMIDDPKIAAQCREGTKP